MKYHYEGSLEYLDVYHTAERPERGFRPKVSLSRRWNRTEERYEYSIGGPSFGGDHERAHILAALLTHGASIANDTDWLHYATKALRYHYSHSNADQEQIDEWIQDEIDKRLWFDGQGPMPEKIRLEEEERQRKIAEQEAARLKVLEEVREEKRQLRNAKARARRAAKKEAQNS